MALTTKQITKRLDEINRTIDEARANLEALCDEIEEVISERSEKWKEGEKGQEWTDAYDGLREKQEALEELSGLEWEVE